jgi:tRNA (cytidine/uridine-2'-O-)-methyltransferase
MLNIVLVEPEIPPNTGNIARTCAATGTALHLIKPLGFSLDNAHLKRAGLDYWEHVRISIYNDLAEFMTLHEGDTFFYASTKAKKLYTDVSYSENCYILFGKETKGLPTELLKDNPENAIRIPMCDNPDLRSLNLANSVNIVLFEALRQNGFKGLY